MHQIQFGIRPQFIGSSARIAYKNSVFREKNITRHDIS